MTIKIVRLMSGEELMGDFMESLDTGEYVMKDVCQIATSFVDNDYKQASIGLMPFIPYADTENGVRFKKAYGPIVLDPGQDILNEYNRIFGSGIVVPSTKPIV